MFLARGSVLLLIDLDAYMRRNTDCRMEQEQERNKITFKKLFVLTGPQMESSIETGYVYITQ
jgi:hypothetical protein